MLLSQNLSLSLWHINDITLKNYLWDQIFFKIIFNMFTQYRKTCDNTFTYRDMIREKTICGTRTHTRIYIYIYLYICNMFVEMHELMFGMWRSRSSCVFFFSELLIWASLLFFFCWLPIKEPKKHFYSHPGTRWDAECCPPLSDCWLQPGEERLELSHKHFKFTICKTVEVVFFQKVKCIINIKLC